MFDFLRPAPHIEEIKDPGQIKETYNYWRIRVFYSMFIGYAFYYFIRKSFIFAMPSMIEDLGFTKTDLGIITSVWAVAYGLSKFVSGVIGDRSNARYFMALGLLATGVCNIFFGLFSSIAMFIICWGANGWFQGFGWPACARLLTHWYSQKERGRWWALWNTSQNIGGAVIPLLTVVVAQYYGWRYAMIFPGVVSIIMAFFLMNRLTDTPASLGLPPIERFRDDYPTKNRTEDERELTVKEILFKYVLNNPYVWILAISYFFVYIIRMAIGNWGQLYLVESKHYSQIEAGGIIFWFECGGFFGNLASGWASDKIFKGSRGPINVIFSATIIGVLFALLSFSQTSILIDCGLIFLAGFCIYGPQMLIGMQAAEIAHKKAAATASGFAGWSAYLGAAVAGWPFGWITQHFGWSGFFVALAVCAIVATLLLIPLWSIRSNYDVEARRAKKAEKEEAEPETVVAE